MSHPELVTFQIVEAEDGTLKVYLEIPKIVLPCGSPRRVTAKEIYYILSDQIYQVIDTLEENRDNLRYRVDRALEQAGIEQEEDYH